MMSRTSRRFSDASGLPDTRTTGRDGASVGTQATQPFSNSSLGQDLPTVTPAAVGSRSVVGTFYMNAIATSGAGTKESPWTGWEQFINGLADSMPGCSLYFPVGYYVQVSTVAVPRNCQIRGDGKLVTIIKTAIPGDAFTVYGRLNSNLSCEVSISGLYIVNTNPDNSGSAINIVACTDVTVRNNFIQGFRYNVICDQCEVSSIQENYLTQALKANIWVVNGEDHTPGALFRASNKIDIIGNEMSQDLGAASINIVDDGGGTHRILGNNLDGGLVGIRIANVVGLRLEGNESEGHQEASVVFEDFTWEAGKSVGQTSGFVIENNVFTDAGVPTDIKLAHAVAGAIYGNFFAQYSEQAITFAGPSAPTAAEIRIWGNGKLLTGNFRDSKPIVGGTAAGYQQNHVEQFYQSYVPASVQVVGSQQQVVQPVWMCDSSDNPECIKVGQTLFIVDHDGSGAEQVKVTAVTATTFTATFAQSHKENFLVYGLSQYFGTAAVPDGAVPLSSLGSPGGALQPPGFRPR